MSWNWSYYKSDGAGVAGLAGSQPFPTQSDAESWIGEAWRELLDQGVDAVVLHEDERVVYGPMSLHPAS